MGTEPVFVPGLELAKGFYSDHVGPLLERFFPRLPYSAALIGSGSEVLGFDTPMSTDHHWGPRAMLFLSEEDLRAHGTELRQCLAHGLPSTYHGYSTHFSEPDPNDNGVQHLVRHAGGPINHRVELNTISGFLQSCLGVPADRSLSAREWLSLPSQKLRSVVSGAVFHDDLGLNAVRARLAWYPADVSMYILGCLWTRIGQEEHLMGRAGSVGDEIGSALIGARIVRDIMRIAFHLESQYPPYPKWLGSAFLLLRSAPRLRPHLEGALHARGWEERQHALARAFEVATEMQHEAGIGTEAPRRVESFFGRPFLVIRGDRLADAAFSRITDPELATLGRDRRIGSVDLVSDNTDVLEDPTLTPLVSELYRL